jgi:phytoene synthase
MVKHEQIKQSKSIQKQTGKTFHLATRVLPERVRHATYVLYAFFRVADEVVDAADTAPPAEQRSELERLRKEALGEQETEDPVLSAFAELTDIYDINPNDINVFIEAMETDVDTSRYETYAELESYMDGSAAAVGRMMTAIMEPAQPERALPHATALGEAFQMTNFIRDVGEDVVDRDRIYLPQETLSKHEIPESQVLDREFDGSIKSAIQDELQRTEALYREGVAGIQYLPEDCQFAVLLAAVLYADHHRAIRRVEYDVLSTTPSLSSMRKFWLFLKTRAHWTVSDDPEEIFKQVSDVPYPDGAEPETRPTAWSTRATGFFGRRFSSLVRHLTRGE